MFRLVRVFVVSSGPLSCRLGPRRVIGAGRWAVLAAAGARRVASSVPAFVVSCRPGVRRVVCPCVRRVVSSGRLLSRVVRGGSRVVPGGGRLDPLVLVNLGDVAPAPCVSWLSVSGGGLGRGTYLGDGVWATVVGDGGGRRAVVVVVEERVSDVTVSHDQPDLAGIGPRAATCPQEAINCLPLNSAMAQRLLPCDYILEVFGSSLAYCIFFSLYIYII